jgi:uncharacterized membrane protein (DUF106 family)
MKNNLKYIFFFIIIGIIIFYISINIQDYFLVSRENFTSYKKLKRDFRLNKDKFSKNINNKIHKIKKKFHI